MSLSISSAKLTGNPDQAGWAQVHEFTPDAKEKLKLRGKLFAVVAKSEEEASGPEGLRPGGGMDSVVAGRELISRLHEEYFGNMSLRAFNALKASVEKVIEEFGKSWGNVEIAAAVQVDDAVYTAAGGGAQIAIERGGMLAKILVSSSNKVVAASGYPREGDTLLLATKRFFDVFSEGVIKAAIQVSDPKASVESLAPSTHSVDGSGDLGAAFLMFGEKKPHVKEKPSEQRDFSSRKMTFLQNVPNLGGVIKSLYERMPSQKIYVGEDEQDKKAQSRKVAASIGAVLLLLLFVSIGFGVKAKRDRDARARYESKLTAAEHQLSEAFELYSLNPVRARQLFSESRLLVEELEAEGVTDPKLDELKIKLEEQEETLLGEYKHEPESFLDLSLFSDGFVGDDIAGAGDKFFVIDKEGEKVMSISVDTKKSEVVAGPDMIDEAQFIASYADRVFVQEEGGVYEVGEEKTKIIDRQWEDEALVYAYAGNLYILDKGASKIWRYPGIEGGFGKATDWLASGVQTNLSDAISWAIDGAIWLVDSSGTIFKFSFGNPQNFGAAGVVPEISDPIAIYTNEEIEGLYVLEAEKNRVVVLNKEGNYVAQYISEKIKDAKDLGVSESGKKIILLVGKELFSLEIKHL